MWRGTVAVLLVAGCGGEDLCADDRVCEVTTPALNAPDDFHLLDDHGRWLVVYGVPLTVGQEAAAGLWAARPGDDPVQVVAGVDAQVVAAIPTSGGVLACWASLSWSIDRPADEGCAVLGDDLHTLAPPVDEPYGAVLQLFEVGDQRFAVSQDQCVGGTPQLTPIDDDGTPTGASVAWPCRVRGQQVVARGDRFACLQPSDPLCGDQFNEPANCRTMLAEYDVTGAALGAPVDVAPFGYYSELADVSLVASDDGYAVAWWYGDPGLHLQIVTPSLALARDSTVPGPAELTGGLTSIGVTPDGYAVTWVPGDQPHPLEVVRFARDGTVVAGSAPLGDDATLPSGYPDTVSYALDGDRAAAAWAAENLLVLGDHREGLLFRSLAP